MAMRAQNDGRRVYIRGGNLILLYGGVYFGPGAKTVTKVSKDHEVTVEAMEKAGGKKRVQVTQVVGKNRVVETWTEKNLVFTKRTAKEDAPSEAPAPSPEA